jgi:hypothetical protein
MPKSFSAVIRFFQRPNDDNKTKITVNNGKTSKLEQMLDAIKRLEEQKMTRQKSTEENIEEQQTLRLPR